MLATATSVLVAAAQDGGFDPLQFQPGAAFWTIVAFVLALPVMWKFVFGPISAALESRDTKVEEAIAASDRARKAAEEQIAQARSELDKARNEARAMVAEASTRAEKQAAIEIEKARAEAQRELRRARDEIESEKRRALQEIRAEVVDLTILSAGKVLRTDVDDEAHRRLVAEFLSASEPSRI